MFDFVRITQLPLPEPDTPLSAQILPKIPDPSQQLQRLLHTMNHNNHPSVQQQQQQAPTPQSNLNRVAAVNRLLMNTLQTQPIPKQTVPNQVSLGSQAPVDQRSTVYQDSKGISILNQGASDPRNNNSHSSLNKQQAGLMRVKSHDSFVGLQPQQHSSPERVPEMAFPRQNNFQQNISLGPASNNNTRPTAFSPNHSNGYPSFIYTPPSMLSPKNNKPITAQTIQHGNNSMPLPNTSPHPKPAFIGSSTNTAVKQVPANLSAMQEPPTKHLTINLGGNHSNGVRPTNFPYITHNSQDKYQNTLNSTTAQSPFQNQPHMSLNELTLQPIQKAQSQFQYLKTNASQEEYSRAVRFQSVSKETNHILSPNDRGEKSHQTQKIQVKTDYNSSKNSSPKQFVKDNNWSTHQNNPESTQIYAKKISSLSKKIDQVVGINEELQAKIQQIKDQLQSRTSENNRLKKKVAELTDKLKDSKKESEHVERTSIEQRAKMQEQLNNIKSTYNSSMSKMQGELNSTRNAMRQMEDRLNLMQAECQNKDREIQKYREFFSHMQNGFEHLSMQQR